MQNINVKELNIDDNCRASVCLEEIYEAINSIELPSYDEEFLNSIKEDLFNNSKNLALELCQSKEASNCFD